MWSPDLFIFSCNLQSLSENKSPLLQETSVAMDANEIVDLSGAVGESLSVGTDTVATTGSSTVASDLQPPPLPDFERIVLKELDERTVEEQQSRDDDSDVFWRSQGLLPMSTQLKEYSEDIMRQGQEYAGTAAANFEAGVCATSAKDNVAASIQDFFSEEQKSARANFAHKTMIMIRTGLSSCHDGVDAILERLYERPVQNVEMNNEDDNSALTEAFTDEVTVESTVEKNNTLSEVVGIPGLDSAESTDSATAASKASTELAGEDILSQIESESEFISAPSDTDEESANPEERRYSPLPEYTPRQPERNVELKPEIIVLAEATESRNDPQDASISKEIEAIDHNIRTDIEKLDALVEKSLGTVEQEPTNITTEVEKLDALADRAVFTVRQEPQKIIKHITVDAFASTPLRGNRSNQREPEFVDLSDADSAYLNKGTGLKMRMEPQHIANSLLPLSMAAVEEIISHPAEEGRQVEEDPRHHGAVDNEVKPVIDLTMYEDALY